MCSRLKVPKMGENYVNGSAKFDVNIFTDCGEGDDGEAPLIQQRNGKLGYVLIKNYAVLKLICFVAMYSDANKINGYLPALFDTETTED